jgi:hypothetical protein
MTKRAVLKWEVPTSQIAVVVHLDGRALVLTMTDTKQRDTKHRSLFALIVVASIVPLRGTAGEVADSLLRNHAHDYLGSFPELIAKRRAAKYAETWLKGRAGDVPCDCEDIDRGNHGSSGFGTGSEGA